MFAMGVQLSWRQFLDVRGTVLGVGVAQSVLIILAGVVVGRAIGLSYAAGLIIGFALMVSSSVVAVRVLADIDAVQTKSGASRWAYRWCRTCWRWC